MSQARQRQSKTVVRIVCACGNTTSPADYPDNESDAEADRRMDAWRDTHVPHGRIFFIHSDGSKEVYSAPHG